MTKPKRPQSDVYVYFVCCSGRLSVIMGIVTQRRLSGWHFPQWSESPSHGVQARQRQCAGQETGWDINCFVTLSSLWYSVHHHTCHVTIITRDTCLACLLPGDRSRLSRRWARSWSWTVSCSVAGGASPPCKCRQLSGRSVICIQILTSSTSWTCSVSCRCGSESGRSGGGCCWSPSPETWTSLNFHSDQFIQQVTKISTSK